MIVAAAIKFRCVLYSLPRPARHWHIIHAIATLHERTGCSGYQGFINEHGVFLNRKEALEEAIACSQVGVLVCPAIGLFSEDLW